MSTCAVMLVKDEADIIEFTIRHLATQVDAIVVADNLSTDGTYEILEGLQAVIPNLDLRIDRDTAYWQSKKTTALALDAAADGFDWVLPCDADEYWHSVDGRPVRDLLKSFMPDVPVVNGVIYHYMPTASDAPASEFPNPFERIVWRLPQPSTLGKAAVRTWRNLKIEAGNHSATFNGRYSEIIGGGLRVNHFSWRSAEQYARKIVNGARAYAETDLPPDTGAHWRMWGDPFADDLPERAADHFRRFFWASHPPCAPGSSDPTTLALDPVYELRVPELVQAP